MTFGIDGSREIFDGILKQYNDYVELYKMINNGSIEGVTPFEDFYWNMTYYTVYDGTEKIPQ